MSESNHGDTSVERPSTSGSDRRTLDALFHHPLAHNLAWRDAVSLFGTLGTVEEKSNDEFAFKVGSEHYTMHKPHTKHLTAPEVLALRHFAARAGWSPTASPPLRHPDPAAPSLVIVIDHHEAKIYQVDMGSGDPTAQAIRPYDPHHFLHHLAHKDQSRERGQRAHEDATFYDRIAKAVAAGGRIVLIGHGAGKSDAAHHLADYLKSHHPETYQRVVSEIVADLSHATAPQLLDLAREALA